MPNSLQSTTLVSCTVSSMWVISRTLILKLCLLPMLVKSLSNFCPSNVHRFRFSVSYQLPSYLSKVSSSSVYHSFLTSPSEFKKKQSGHIINVGSIAGREAYAGGSIYCATKHAVNAFSGSLLRELVNTPIRVTEVQPGMLHYPISTSPQSFTRHG